MSVNMKSFDRPDVPAVLASLTPRMLNALLRCIDNDPAVAPATFNALKQRGLVKLGRRGEWRWTALARMVRRGTHGSMKADPSGARRRKREADGERSIPKGKKRKLKP